MVKWKRCFHEILFILCRQQYRNYKILSHAFLTKNSWKQRYHLRGIFSVKSFLKTSLVVKTLLSRNFCQSAEHSVEITKILSRIFDKNFVKPQVLLKELLKCWFHEIFFWCEREFLVFFQTVHSYYLKNSVKSIANWHY